ncbi:MAG: efflux RND transporter periplasmic adaptor subunit [Firmicutes bacterium]|jgi:RND family efflux transporter MFP subunit|nr:efflux RND transporter periplasmic adaptor subunit [Bacillota bacterium]
MKKVITYILLAAFLTGCSTTNAEQSSRAELRTVATQTVEANGYGNVLTVSGNIVPTQTVKASFKIPGVLYDVAVSEGESVFAGQTIATLDKVDYNIQVKGAQAQRGAAQAQTSAAVAQREAATAQKDAAAIDIETAQLQLDTEIPTKIEQAKAQYDLTKTSYDRVKTLYEQGIASKSQFDEISAKLTVDQNTYQQALDAKSIAESKIKSAQSQLHAAEAQISMTNAQVSASNAQIAASEAQLDAAKNNLDDTVLTSPINGVVLQKISEKGETISAGYPIVAIGDISSVYAEIGVTDEAVNQITKGQQAEIYIYGLNETVTGVVDEINSLADTTTRTFPVKIRIDNADGKLKPGMVCRAEIPMDNIKSIFVPIDSIIHFAEGSAVFVLNENNTVSKKTVTTGEITGDKIQIYSGLQSGDVIVTKGQFTLHDGDTVQIEEMTE